MLRVHTVAELEATEAARWYDAQRKGLGDEFLAEFDRSLRTIDREPAAFPAYEYYQGPVQVQRCLLKRFPYLLFFVRRHEDVEVFAVGHARRKPLYWLDRLNRGKTGGGTDAGR